MRFAVRCIDIYPEIQQLIIELIPIDHSPFLRVKDCEYEICNAFSEIGHMENEIYMTKNIHKYCQFYGWNLSWTWDKVLCYHDGNYRERCMMCDNYGEYDEIYVHRIQ
jgi:hypothetical protein